MDDGEPDARRQCLYAAKLLKGEMPEDIEEMFASVGLALFPTSAAQLSMDCSCPDWSVPCKHLAAVFYLLAESFDDDPFGMLAWRGRDRTDLLDTLSALRTGAHAADRTGTSQSTVPLADCLESFFTARGEVSRRPSSASPSASSSMSPSAGDAVLDQLPALDTAVRGTPLVGLLRPAYARLTQP